MAEKKKEAEKVEKAATTSQQQQATTPAEPAKSESNVEENVRIPKSNTNPAAELDEAAIREKARQELLAEQEAEREKQEAEAKAEREKQESARETRRQELKTMGLAEYDHYKVKPRFKQMIIVEEGRKQNKTVLEGYQREKLLGTVKISERHAQVLNQQTPNNHQYYFPTGSDVDFVDAEQFITD